MDNAGSWGSENDEWYGIVESQCLEK